jgi:hypothetical protein
VAKGHYYTVWYPRKCYTVKKKKKKKKSLPSRQKKKKSAENIIYYTESSCKAYNYLMYNWRKKTLVLTLITENLK